MTSNLTVSSAWLTANLNDEKLILLDASMKPVTLLAKEKSEGLIPNSIRFDIKEFSDETSPYSHTLLPRAIFIEKMQALGVNDDSIVVIYDNVGVYSSPRVLYMLKDFGHSQVYVLDGGLPAWIAENRAIVHNWILPSVKGDFSDRGEVSLFCDSNDVLTYLEDEKINILDARSSKRFHGIEPEPRTGIKSGHIPNSINLPFENVLVDGKFKSKEELEAIFGNLPLNGELFIFSCGSGITSCIIALAAEMSGYTNVKIYDGSWTEWADVNNSYPIDSALNS